MRYCITIILIFLSSSSWATTWGPVYPFVQKTENGKVKTHSIPYGVYDGPHGPGETFVYSNGNLLYSIDKYFLSPFFTTNNGQYLIEFDFHIDYHQPLGNIDDSGNVTTEPIIYDGKAVNIYKDGKLFKTIDFKELKIDNSKIKVNNYGNQFSWNYSINDSIKNKLKMKMYQHPAFIEENKLYLISVDNQLISIEIETGNIIDRQNAFEILKLKTNWKPNTIKRKYKKVKYPDKFFLPNLQNGKSIDKALSELIDMRTTEGDKDSALLQIYFHTLLINKDGKCEEVYVSPSRRSDLKNDFYDEVDKQLKTEIEKWVMGQTFNTKTIPNKFLKYKYSDFVYLKE